MSQSLYTEEKCKAICDHIAQGLSQRQSCQMEDVDEGTFRSWKRDVPEALTHYRAAREERNLGWSEELVEIVDSVDLDGDPQVVRNRIALAKERMNARQWSISRILKDFRDKQETVHSGAVDLGAMTEDEIRRRFEQIMAKQT